MHPSTDWSEVLGRKRYTIGNSILIASDEYWDGHNWERQGRNTFLYRTPNGNYFTANMTMWQGERNILQPINEPEAVELWDRASPRRSARSRKRSRAAKWSKPERRPRDPHQHRFEAGVGDSPRAMNKDTRIEMELYVYVDGQFHDRESIGNVEMPIALGQTIREWAATKCRAIKTQCGEDWLYLDWLPILHPITDKSCRVDFTRHTTGG